jgi:elongation factor G
MKDESAIRETITKAAEGEGKFIRRSGSAGQYGHVVVRVAPNEKGRGNEVIYEVVGGAIPVEFATSVVEAVRQGLRNGVLAGFPVVDVVVRIVDGSSHAIDSSKLAFKMAGLFALKNAMKNADPILLE